MVDGLLERVEKLEGTVRSSLSQLRHLQQLSEAELKRDALDNLEQIRREMSDVVSRMASLAEVNALKDDLNRIFNLIGNPHEASFSGSIMAGNQSSSNSEVTDRLTKAVKACEEKLDKLQTSLGNVDICSKLEGLEKRLDGLEAALAELRKSDNVKSTDSTAECSAKKSDNSSIFDDEPVEWG